METVVLNKNWFPAHVQPVHKRLKHLTFFDITRKPHFGSVFMSCRLMQELQVKGVQLNVLLFDYAFVEHEGTYAQYQRRVDIYREYFKAVAPLTGLDISAVNFIDAVEFLRKSPDRIWAQLQELSKKITLNIPAYKQHSKDFHLNNYLREAFYMTAIKFFDPDIYHSGADECWGRRLLPGDNSCKGKVVLTHEVLPRFSPKICEALDVPFNIANKMTKGDECSALLCNESPSKLAGKIGNSFCLEGDADRNAVLDWINETVYKVDRDFRIIRPAKWGGDQTLGSFDELVERFKAKGIHPFDLKTSFVDYFTNWTEQMRQDLESSEVFESYGYVYDQQ
jgi:hypothetical protein